MESALSDPVPASRIPAESVDGPLVGAARKVETTARDVKERVARKSLGEIVEDGRHLVRENPVKAVVIAAGVGALVGFVLGRRRA